MYYKLAIIIAVCIAESGCRRWISVIKSLRDTDILNTLSIFYNSTYLLILVQTKLYPCNIYLSSGKYYLSSDKKNINILKKLKIIALVNF